MSGGSEQSPTKGMLKPLRLQGIHTAKMGLRMTTEKKKYYMHFIKSSFDLLRLPVERGRGEQRRALQLLVPCMRKKAGHGVSVSKP